MPLGVRDKNIKICEENKERKAKKMFLLAGYIPGFTLLYTHKQTNKQTSIQTNKQTQKDTDSVLLFSTSSSLKINVQLGKLKQHGIIEEFADADIFAETLLVAIKQMNTNERINKK